MKHKHHWIFFWYHSGCIGCKIRQLKYGFRMDPEGYNKARLEALDDKRFTNIEKMYIIAQCKPIQVIY